MKVVCIKKFLCRFDESGNEIGLGWTPQIGKIYTVIAEVIQWGIRCYRLAECPRQDQIFQQNAFRPLDFGEEVCTEIEKEFVSEPEIVEV